MSTPLSTIQDRALAGDKSAEAILARFENRYLDMLDEGKQIASCMQAETSNNGRNPLADKAPDHVNGSEIRASERWKRTAPRQKREGRQIVVDPETLAELGSNAAILCAQIGGERWTPLPSAQRETRPRKRPEVDLAARRHKEAVQAIVAKLDNAADREAIAQGIA